MDALADVLLPTDTADAVAFRVATVTSTAPVEVSLAGADDLSAAFCASYAPVVTDVVLVLQTKTDLIIIDKIIPGG